MMQQPYYKQQSSHDSQCRGPVLPDGVEKHLRPAAATGGAALHLRGTQQQRAGRGAAADGQPGDDAGRNSGQKWTVTPENCLDTDGFGAQKRHPMPSRQVI